MIKTCKIIFRESHKRLSIDYYHPYGLSVHEHLNKNGHFVWMGGISDKVPETRYKKNDSG